MPPVRGRGSPLCSKIVICQLNRSVLEGVMVERHNLLCNTAAGDSQKYFSGKEKAKC
jgi:hypothetical protein